MAYEQSQRLNDGAGAAAASRGSDGRSAEQIKRDIDHTRAEMDRTVDALGERLQPRHLLDDLVAVFRGRSGIDSATLSGAGQTAKDYGWMVVDKLKQHPVPAALIGAGLTWLLFEGDNPSPAYASRNAGVPRDKLTGPGMYSGSYVDARTGQPYTENYGSEFRGGGAAAGFTPEGAGHGTHGAHPGASGAGDSAGRGMLGAAGEKASGVGHSIADTASGAMDSARSAAQSAKETIAGAARSAGEAVSSWTGSARDAASSTGHRMSEGASYAGGQFQHGYESTRQTFLRGLEDYPLAMGAAAFAAGVLAGICLPGTRREDRLMGGAADQVKESVKSTGEHLLERGKHVAAATASAAADEANRQGLNPDELGQKVKDFAGRVTGAVKDAAHEEGLNPDSLGEKVRHVAERAKDTAAETANTEAHEQKREMQF